jgi:hypothetical protein
MAQRFGVADYTKLETQHLSLFKKYLASALEEWENEGDMDYLKNLGMYKTRPKLTGTVAASLGIYTVTLSAASDVYAVGCDLQIADKTYIITQMNSTTSFDIFPAFMDATVTAAAFELRYNRFPVPPYFKRVLNRQMYYFEQIGSIRIIEEKDFVFVNKSNSPADPQWFQIKHTARQNGFSGTGTISGDTLTVTVGSLTQEMAGLPFRTASLQETYFIRSVTSSSAAVLDRAVSTAVAVAEAFVIIPEGTMFFEVYPHPDESKQIIYDYLTTESNKQALADVIIAPPIVIESILDVSLAKFEDDSASSRQELRQASSKQKELSKKKNVTNYVPSLSYFGRDGKSYPSASAEDYGGLGGQNYRGNSLRDRRGR